MFIEYPSLTINIGTDLPGFEKVDLNQLRYNIIKQCLFWLNCQSWNIGIEVNFTEGIQDQVIYSDQSDPDSEEIEKNIFEIVGGETYFLFKQANE